MLNKTTQNPLKIKRPFSEKVFLAAILLFFAAILWIIVYFFVFVRIEPVFISLFGKTSTAVVGTVNNSTDSYCLESNASTCQSDYYCRLTEIMSCNTRYEIKVISGNAEQNYTIRDYDSGHRYYSVGEHLKIKVFKNTVIIDNNRTTIEQPLECLIFVGIFTGVIIISVRHYKKNKQG